MKSLLVLITLILVTPSFAEPLVYEGTDGIGHGQHIVFIANDHEYRSEQTCPLIAKILAKHHGFRCTVLFGVDADGNIKPGGSSVPGLEALADADLLFFFTRFMNLPDDQAGMIVDYFERGGPVVAARTSTHCFNGQAGKWSKLNFDHVGDDYYGGLGKQIFGLTWNKAVPGQTHYGTNHQMGSRITPVVSAADHPILSGTETIHAYSGAYKSEPPADATPLLQVQVLNTFEPSDDINQDKPVENAGWTRNMYVAPSGQTKQARVVYTSFGASEDMLDESGRRFFLNACLWASGMESMIKPDLDVSIVGGYSPSPYNNAAFYYEGVHPSDLAGWDSNIMPASATMAGVGQGKPNRRHLNVLQNRPELRAMLVEKYPGIYGHTKP